MSGTITADLLGRHKACYEQIAIFKAEWPEGCEVTAETLARARELGLKVGWAIQQLLTHEAREECDRMVELALQEFRTRCDAEGHDAAYSQYERDCNNAITAAFSRGLRQAGG